MAGSAQILRLAGRLRSSIKGAAGFCMQTRTYPLHGSHVSSGVFVAWRQARVSFCLTCFGSSCAVRIRGSHQYYRLPLAVDESHDIRLLYKRCLFELQASHDGFSKFRILLPFGRWPVVPIRYGCLLHRILNRVSDLLTRSKNGCEAMKAATWRRRAVAGFAGRNDITC